jgi:molybdate transport system permease protein
MFSPAGAVVAAAAVALPLLERASFAAFLAVDPEHERVARTLGKGRLATFRLVTVPLAARGLGAALALGFARALGEFGATLMFAGNIPRRTTTLPLALYTAYLTGDHRAATVLTASLSALSLAVVLATSLLTRERPRS